MATIWFDLTTSRVWRRPVVGVVRAEQNCARAFLQYSRPGIRFCFYDRAHGSFFELPREEVELILSPEYHAPVHEEPGPAAPPLSRSDRLERRIKTTTKTALSVLPGLFRTPLEHSLRARKRLLVDGISVLRSANATARQARAMFRGEAPPPPEPPLPEPPYTRTSFGADCVLVSMGLDWDNKDLPELYRLKNQTGLKVLWFCYDLIPVRFPHLCVGEVADFFSHYFCDAAWCADKVLCISECSRRDLVNVLDALGAPAADTAVVRLGCEIPPRRDVPPSAEVAAILREPYILFVSTIEKRKNHEMIYRAVVRLLDGGRVDLPRVVFVGMHGWGVNDFMNDLRFDPRVRDRICVLNRVSDDDLAQLYRNTLFTLFPSLYEGWGLPVAESLAYGKFCIASSMGALPEVGGDLIDYLDPWDIHGWVGAISRYLDGPAALAAREAQIRTHFRPTKWSQTAATVYDAAMALLPCGDKTVEGPSVLD